MTRPAARTYRLHALVDSLVRDGRSEQEVAAAVAAADDVPAPRVLVAEDETITRLDIRELLTDAGFDVCAEAANGEQAVELALRHEPDVILMDAELPRLDGVSAAHRIRARRRIPIVMVTGYEYGELIDRARDAGITAYLVKPFGGREMIEAVHAAVTAV